ncbi:hypothetical protein [Nocardia terpenica]|uniref:Uncharacterized protein n=1 Tax=Nocardia terpenica TaxID=455432 RepID=A0A6G9Z783_9NOCA|nr:hypothetical protein [Nocardia terpenica]QIS21026.1 hypothetical protein F6W96_24615 [Nocardia terpenica]
MNDVPTPQDALDIASAATEQARTAPAMPRWVPPVGGLLAGGTIVMIKLAPRSDDGVHPFFLVAALAAITVLYVITNRLSREWLNSGVMPRSAHEEPVERWKQRTMYWLPLVFFCFLAPLMTGWLIIPAGLIAGGWIWFQLARRRVPWAS